MGRVGRTAGGRAPNFNIYIYIYIIVSTPGPWPLRFVEAVCTLLLKMCTAPSQNHYRPIPDLLLLCPWMAISRGRSSKNRLLRLFGTCPHAQTSDPCRGFGSSPPRRTSAFFPPGLQSATPVVDSALLGSSEYVLMLKQATPVEDSALRLQS